MDLIVFDLDGTLLNAAGEISPFTRETLQLLETREIAYTVATGRTRHGSLEALNGASFPLPQAYKNGVMVWDPARSVYTHRRLLSPAEASPAVEELEAQGLTPFLFAVEDEDVSVAYHAPLRSQVDELLAEDLRSRSGLRLRPLEQMADDAQIANVSALGAPGQVGAAAARGNTVENLVAFASVAIEGADLMWVDIHRRDASKGSAVDTLRAELGVTRVLVFGDSFNDASMFEVADESYAPSNAKPELQELATSVIGHHDEDGIARFLRERFSL